MESAKTKIPEFPWSWSFRKCTKYTAYNRIIIKKAAAGIGDKGQFAQRYFWCHHHMMKGMLLHTTTL